MVMVAKGMKVEGLKIASIGYVVRLAVVDVGVPMSFFKKGFGLEADCWAATGLLLGMLS